MNVDVLSDKRRNRARMRRPTLLETIRTLGRTTEGRRLGGYVGTVLLLSACVEIAGIEEAHPRVDEVDREWANWPMPNPPGLGLPRPAIYTIDTDKNVVIDNITGLMWKRAVAEEFVELFRIEDAEDFCSNDGQGGFNDWRLPTAIEAISIMDFTRKLPAAKIDPDAFPGVPAGVLWTSSRSPDSTKAVFFRRFQLGHIKNGHPRRSAKASTLRTR